MGVGFTSPPVENNPVLLRLNAKTQAREVNMHGAAAFVGTAQDQFFAANAAGVA